MKLKQIASALMVLGMSPLAFADFTIQDIRVEGLQRTEPSTVFNYPKRPPPHPTSAQGSNKTATTPP